MQQGKEKYQEEIDELLQKKLKLQEKLNELKNTGIANWNNLSNNFEDHLQKLDIAFANFKKKLGV